MSHILGRVTVCRSIGGATSRGIPCAGYLPSVADSLFRLGNASLPSVGSEARSCCNRSVSTVTEVRKCYKNSGGTVLSAKDPVGWRQHSSQSEKKKKESDGSDDKSDLEEAASHVKGKQREVPWQREGSQLPPVRRQRSAGAMKKGKLLTTPSRLLKLILPVTTRDYNKDRKDIEPLALLVHPQQPLSYLERLIQAEVPPVKGQQGGNPSPPTVSFLAVEIRDDTIRPKGAKSEEEPDQEKRDDEKSPKMQGQPVGDQSASDLRGGPGEGGVEMYGNLEKSEPETVDRSKFIRWSSSTEIGDFIRDAARAKEFLVEIEDSPLGCIPVGVPSFNDRTYYLRMRLRKVSRKLKDLAVIKHDCDVMAHRGAQRVALGGLGVLVSWWGVVYTLTFDTELGWDTMEPITYLVSLSTLMVGYAWFLYHNREISYRSALDFTVNRRQQKLYQMKGVDLQLWESLIEEGNALRREIKTVAEEYDVDWNEKADEQDQRVTNVLKEDRQRRNGKSKGKKGDDDQDSHDDDD